MTVTPCGNCGNDDPPLAIGDMRPSGGVNEVCPDCGFVRAGPREGFYLE